MAGGDLESFLQQTAEPFGGLVGFDEQPPQSRRRILRPGERILLERQKRKQLADFQEILSQQPGADISGIFAEPGGVESLTTQQFRSPNLLERLFAPVSALQQGVLNVGQAIGSAAEGDFLDALRGLGRAGGSLVSGATFGGAEDLLDLFGVREDVGRALAPEDTIGTLKSLPSAFASPIGELDIAREVLGRSQGDIERLRDAGLFGAIAEDPAAAGVATAAGLLTDPLTFLGVGAPAKFTKVAKTAVTGGVDQIARQAALRSVPEAAEEFARLGLNPLVAGKESLIALPSKVGRKFESEMFRERARLIRQGLDEPDAFKSTLLDYATTLDDANPLKSRIFQSVELGERAGVKSLIVGRNFREQAELGQRTVFFGPYGAILRRTLSPFDGSNAVTQAIDRNFFGGLTELNKAFGQSGRVFSDGAASLERLNRGVGTGDDIDNVFSASKSLANVADKTTTERLASTVSRVASKLLTPIRKGLITDADTAQVNSLMTSSVALESMVGRARDKMLVPLIQKIDDLVSDPRFAPDKIEDAWASVRRRLETGEDDVFSTGDEILDGMLDNVYQETDKFRDDLLKLQNDFGVDVKKFASNVAGEELGYFARLQTDDFIELIRTNPKARLAFDRYKSTRFGPQVIKRSEAARKLTTDKLEEELKRFLADEGVRLPEGFKFFKTDLKEVATGMFENSANAVQRARMFDELVRLSAKTPPNETVASFVGSIEGVLDNAAALLRDKKLDELRGILPKKVFNKIVDAVGERAPKDGTELLDLLPSTVKANFIRESVAALGKVRGENAIDALQFLKRQKYRMLPDDLESLVQYALQDVPVSVIDDFERFSSRFSKQAESGLGKLFDQTATLARSTILSSPTSVATDFWGNVFTRTFISGRAGIKGLREALAFVSSLGGSKVLSKGKAAFGKVPDRTIQTAEGAVSYADEAKTAIDAGLFARARGIVEEGAPLTGGANAFTRGVKSIGREGFALREAQDNAFRLDHYIARREAGDSVEDAISSARKVFFDYSDVTKFEKTFARRLMLFYTFAKKSMPLVFRSYFEHPIRMKLFQTVAGAMANFDPDAEQWVNGLSGNRIGLDQYGSPVLASLSGSIFDPARRIFATQGDNVVEHAANVVSGLMKSAAPLPRAIAELSFDRDFFTGKLMGLTSKGREQIAKGEPVADRAPSWMNHPLIRPAAEKLLGFGQKIDAKGNITGFRMDPQKRWLFENLMYLGSWSRSAELAANVAGADPRATLIESAGPFLGVTFRDLPTERASQVLLRKITRFETELSERLEDVEGRPFKISHDSLVPDKRTPEGKRISEDIDRISVEVNKLIVRKNSEAQRRADILRLTGERRKRFLDENTIVGEDERNDVLNGAINSWVNHTYSEFGFYRDYFERLRRAKDYLIDPDAVLAKWRDKLGKLAEKGGVKLTNETLGGDVADLLSGLQPVK